MACAPIALNDPRRDETAAASPAMLSVAWAEGCEGSGECPTGRRNGRAVWKSHGRSGRRRFRRTENITLRGKTVLGCRLHDHHRTLRIRRTYSA
jgi:hypothetical protein